MRHRVPTGHRGFAKAMRRESTEAERRLWQILRGKQLDGLKFKRQQPFAGFIVDFVCFDAKLIVEADGSQHAESEADASRDAKLAELGYRVLRLWNNDILANPDGVVVAIAAAANLPQPSQSG